MIFLHEKHSWFYHSHMYSNDWLLHFSSQINQMQMIYHCWAFTIRNRKKSWRAANASTNSTESVQRKPAIQKKKKIFQETKKKEFIHQQLALLELMSRKQSSLKNSWHNFIDLLSWMYYLHVLDIVLNYFYHVSNGYGWIMPNSVVPFDLVIHPLQQTLIRVETRRPTDQPHQLLIGIRPNFPVQRSANLFPSSWRGALQKRHRDQPSNKFWRKERSFAFAQELARFRDGFDAGVEQHDSDIGEMLGHGAVNLGNGGHSDVGHGQTLQPLEAPCQHRQFIHRIAGLTFRSDLSIYK